MKITFLTDHKVQQFDGNGPFYEKGKTYDFDGFVAETYAQKFVRLGLAEDVATEAAPGEPADPGTNGEGLGDGDPEPQRPDDEAKLFAEILEAAAMLDGADSLTADGRPQVKALEAVLGYDISAEERDAAWAGRPEA